MSTPAPKPTLNQVLRPRKLKNLTPGAPDLPQPRRTSAQVRAEKQRKEAEKEASATKTKAAKARVNGLREALHREQVDPKTSSREAGTGPRKARPTPTPKGTVSKPKVNLNPKKFSSPPAEATESSADGTMVSAGRFSIHIRHSLICL